jgi:hypothetical protein
MIETKLVLCGLEAVLNILGGDKYGGGHRFGKGKPGKTEFPSKLK